MHLRSKTPAECGHSLLAGELAAIEAKPERVYATYLSSEDFRIRLASGSTVSRDGIQGGAALIMETVPSASIRRW